MKQLRSKIKFAAILLVLFNTFCFGRFTLFVTETQNDIEEYLISKSNDKIKAEPYSNKKLGSFIEDGKTYFRLFTPNAIDVKLVLFDKPGEKANKVYNMKKDNNSVWEVSFDENLSGKFYGYKVLHSESDNISQLPLCVDPYAKAVATYTDFMNPRLSIVYTNEYDWEDDKWIQRDWKDAIIYEMHVRDMTVHPSAEAKHPGTYKGLTEKDITGGLPYIKELGVNTVELLPAHEFGNMEIPFKDSLAGRFNNWNPYERNHWGYMTSNFFAPAAYYAQDWKEFNRNVWMGTDAKQVTEFKDMVKSFHNEGIAVVMDVVFNHLSEYETGNLKEIDRDYYFRLNDDGSLKAESGCGNDIKTEAPMMRRLIVESILFWMEEYHVDGFRFDLGKLIDWVTIEKIIHEARKINPNVIFVCEPWGGGYDPQGFSLRDWGAWNDQIRNGIKGENPFNGKGWIFGNWYGNNSKERVMSYVNGTLVRDSLGLFQKKDHSVNYLESHDGYTFGDFIRIGTGAVKGDEIIEDMDKNAKLPEDQLRLNKLGAMFLFTSQGMTMIHSGQEFAHSKVIPVDTNIEDEHKGMLDHNTYNKDNEVNYINFDHAKLNKELFNYYKGLIELRKEYKAFRHAKYEDVKFVHTDDQFTLAYTVEYKNELFTVLFNSNPNDDFHYTLPEGEWEMLANWEKAGTDVIETVSDEVKLTPTSGMILKKK